MKMTQENKKILSLTLTLLMIALLVALFGLAYARYMSSASGTATAQVANLICKMEVESSSEDAQGNPTPFDETIIHPYCILTIKDYEGETAGTATKVTEGSLNYTVTVTPKEQDFTLPTYYWENMSTHEIINTANLQGTFTKGQAEDQQYKIVFTNAGTANITKHVNFNLTAVQARNQ